MAADADRQDARLDESGGRTLKVGDRARYQYATGWPTHDVMIVATDRLTTTRVRFHNGEEAWVYKRQLSAGGGT